MIGLYIVIGLLVAILVGIMIYHYKTRNKASVKAADEQTENCEIKQCDPAPEPLTIATLFPSLNLETTETLEEEMVDDFERIACA